MGEDYSTLRTSLLSGIPDILPNHPGFDDSVDHAPNRRQVLDESGKRMAIRNALRYFNPKHHRVLGKEFLDELNSFGRITMQRYRPTDYEIKAHPISAYPAKSQQAAAITVSYTHLTLPTKA